MAKRKPRTYNLHRLITAAARRIWFYSPMRREVVRLATRANGRIECAECGELVGKGEYAVDHIDPVINVKSGFAGYDAMFAALFCSPEDMQVLCKIPCHRVKTLRENAQRKKKK